ncbi:uncharacterized protein METZ01_LOCUS287103, partial [marine metagenome]
IRRGILSSRFLQGVCPKPQSTI